MPILRGVRVRTLLAVVALVALLLGVVIDLQNRWRRDFYARRESEYRVRIDWHRDQEADCRSRWARGDPYPAAERRAVISRGLGGLKPMLNPPFRWPLHGWDLEAAEHRSWIDRLEVMAGHLAAMKRMHERRLLLP